MVDENVFSVSLYDLFCESVKLHANRIAVRYDNGDAIEQFSYQSVAEQAAKVASCLQGITTRSNEIVGLYCRHFVGLPACILGILHAGSAFAPVDIHWPPKLVVQFLTKLEVKVILVDPKLTSEFQNVLSSFPKDYGYEFQDNQELLPFGFCLVKVYPYLKTPDMVSGDGISTGRPCEFAYVMQTSGTTGGPKTVMVPHKCIVPNIFSLRDIFRMTYEDIVLLASPYTFDPSVVQMFLALSSGSVLVIVPDSLKMMPTRLFNVVIDRQKVTVLQPTSSLMYSCGSEVIKSKILSKDTSLRLLAFGGEECPPLTTLRHWKSANCKTELYNLYGITEVSSWATCHHISETDLSSSEHPSCLSFNIAQRNDSDFSKLAMVTVPLGMPLLDTWVELRDAEGEAVTEGAGQVFIGGKQRVCLLEGETSLKEGTFRASGDWAYIKDGKLWYCGRTDRQIKRYGKQLNLSWLEHVISKTANGAQCCVVPRHIPSDTHGFIHLLLHTFILCSDTTFSSASESECLSTKLKQLLPPHAIPDSLDFVTSFPITSHGKVDMKALLNTVSRDSNTEKTTEVRQILGYFWRNSLQQFSLEEQEVTTLSRNCKWPQPTSHIDVKPSYLVGDLEEFVSNGGSSLQAISLANQIESWMNETLATEHHVVVTSLVDIILNKTFSELVGYATKKLGNNFEEEKKSVKKISGTENISSIPVSFQQMKEKEETREICSEAECFAGDKRNYKTAAQLEIPKKSFHSLAVKGSRLSELGVLKHKKLKVSHFVETDVSTDCCCSVRRGSQKFVCRLCRKIFEMSECIHSTNRNTDSVLTEQIGSTNLLSRLIWRKSLFKCVDASPLVVWSCKRGKEGEVFIGSHAHVFMAIRLSDGTVIWQVTLGDRIESSAVLSECGTFVIVGCYDGKVYFLERATGAILWVFKTGGPVKSSPCVDTSTGRVWIGSHDHHLYALDPSKKQCGFDVDCESGSVFSSPVVSREPAHLVYAATLGGRVVAVDPDEGSIIWSHQCPKPVFASPAVTPAGVLCACADKSVYCFDSMGRVRWTFHTKAPVFSSPVYYSNNSFGDHVLVGSHDKNIYCLTPDGKLTWSFAADSQLYATPFIAPFLCCHGDESEDQRKNPLVSVPIVFVFSTCGTMYALNLSSGVVLNDPVSFPGEVFSSPVVVSNRILIGCRDDYLYCLELFQTRNT